MVKDATVRPRRLPRRRRTPHGGLTTSLSTAGTAPSARRGQGSEAGPLQGGGRAGTHTSQPKREEGDQGAEAGKPADRWFAFASKKCRTKFLKTPGKYTAQVTLECVTRLPQLIRLLKLSPDRATVDYACQLVNASEKSKEYGTQTQTHVVERRVDPNYCWNVWDLRKRGLQVRHAER